MPKQACGHQDSQSVQWGDNCFLNDIDGNVARLLARFVKELCCSIKVILADAGTGAPIKSKRLSGTYLIFK